MAMPIDELAAEIVTLEPEAQETLWERVAELNFQRGLKDLSQTYRARLAAEGELDKTAEVVLAELKQLREDIAAHDYRT